MDAQAQLVTRQPQPPVISEKLAEKYSADMQGRLTQISITLRAQFENEVRQRTMPENRWLKDLRQYKGLYEPDEWRRLSEEKSRSRVFTRITRKKVRAFDSRMMDLLFPGGKSKNWSITATPEPSSALTPLAQKLLQEKKQEMLQEIAQQLSQENQIPPDQVMARLQQEGMPIEIPDSDRRQINKAAAKAACERMESTISDQLAEIKYKKICHQVIHSGNLYGVGIMKAPLAQMKIKPYWLFEQDQWQHKTQELLVPFIEFVPVWSFYPDSSARYLEECEYMYQRHVMTKAEVAALASRPGFEDELISDYLREFPNGDCSPRTWETLLDVSNRDDAGQKNDRTHKKYEVLEYWGTANDQQLQELGINEDPMRQIWICVWMLGDFVIKMGASPIDGINHIYHSYHFEDDETSFWSEGIPSIIRDDQTSLNAVNRAMMDNAAATVGAMYEVNTDLVSPREDVRNIRPNKVLLRSGDSRQPAVRDIQVQSRISEFMAVRGMFEQQINNSTLPSYMQGGSAGGAGRTASGLSMLMGSASMDIKDQVMLFDSGITAPVIKSLYHWNMTLNDDPYIKGDYDVIATGTSSLMAKEVLGQQLDQLLPVLSNPMYEGFVDKRRLIEMMLQIRDLTDAGIILEEDDFDQIMALKQQIAALQQELAQGKALLTNLWKVAPSLVQQAMDRTVPNELG